MTTGEIIKKLRKEKRLTQEQVGNYIGVQKSAVAKWENGKVNNLKRDTIDALALLFGVQPSYLLGEADEALMLDAEEIKIIKAYRLASDSNKKIIRMMLELEDAK